jgi:hypothetical protein
MNLYNTLTPDKMVECNVCRAPVKCNDISITSHYRPHIKRGEATQEDKINFLKEVGLYRNLDQSDGANR